LSVSADYLLGRPDAKPSSPKGPFGKLRQAVVDPIFWTA